MDYRPAKRRRGGPSIDEVKYAIDKRESEKKSQRPPSKKEQKEEEKKRIRLSTLESEISKARKNLPKFKKDGKFNLKNHIKKINLTISKLADHIRKSVSRIETIEKKIVDFRKVIAPKKKLNERLTNTEKKVTIIKNIIKNQQSTIGQKIPGSNQDNLYKTLVETNKLLVDIQKQLVDSIKKEIKDSKEKERKESVESSKKKLKAEESLLEKTSKAINKGVKKVANKMLSPIKNIFDKIIDFLLILGGGIAANAVFEWLKDPKNMDTVKGVFKFIQDNYRWILGAAAGLAALKIVGPIMTLLKPLGMLVGLFAKAVPLLITVLTNPIFLGVAAGAGLLLGMKATVDFFKRRGAGGEAHLDAFEALKDELGEAGINVKGTGKNEKFYLSGTGRGAGDRYQKSASGGTEEQKALIENYKKRRDALIDDKNAMKAEISKQRDAVEPVMKEVQTPARERQRGAGATKTVEDRQATEKLRNEAESRVRAQFEGNIPSILERRKMGGPVRAGKPYIVGDQLGMKTAEIFVPSSDGTVISNFDTNKIINNLKTQKIYQIISKKKKRSSPSINMMELPAIVNKGKPPEISLPSGSATEVPQIASSDSSNPYLEKSLQIYGIMV
jgi:hypothetical protein